MNSVRISICASFLLVFNVYGCSPGTSNSNAVEGAHTLTHTGGLASVDECPNGGVELQHGVDVDGNGVLDPQEVKDTYAICNGEDGSSQGLDEVTARLADAETKLANLQDQYDVLKVDYDVLVDRIDGQDTLLSEHGTALTAKANTTDLATVATSGSHADLSDVPDLSVFAAQTDVETLQAEIANKANIGDLSAYVAQDVFESTIANFPILSSLSTVAFSGLYSDLNGAPDITGFVVASDLAEVAYTGDYGQLSGSPDLSALVAESELAAVAFSGSYNDLADQPESYELPAELDAFNGYLSVDEATNKIEFSGANLYITDGTGQTICLDESALPDLNTCNSLGNLIVGYAENLGSQPRTGSHNLITGSGHGWTGYGGFISGRYNVLAGAFASTLGGSSNLATGEYSVTVGGQGNSTYGNNALCAGGSSNVVQGEFSVSVGGTSNHAVADRTLCAGGAGNTATGDHSVTLGGAGNIASASTAIVAGGSDNQALGSQSIVFGGQFGVAHGLFSSVFGGYSYHEFEDFGHGP